MPLPTLFNPGPLFVNTFDSIQHISLNLTTTAFLLQPINYINFIHVRHAATPNSSISHLVHFNVMTKTNIIPLEPLLMSPWLSKFSNHQLTFIPPPN